MIDDLLCLCGAISLEAGVGGGVAYLADKVEQSWQLWPLSEATLLMLSDRKVRADNCCMQKIHTHTLTHTHKLELKALRSERKREQERQRRRAEDNARISANCSTEIST